MNHAETLGRRAEPRDNLRFRLTGEQPELERMFAEAALRRDEKDTHWKSCHVAVKQRGGE